MSLSNQNGHTAAATQTNEQSPSFANDLETLIPKNLSSNKRAVIERLITLYQQK